MHCEHCGHASDGRFCPNCGHAIRGAAAVTPTPGDFRSAALAAAGYHWTWPHTLWTLLRRPQVLIADHLAGRRGSYIGPVKFFVSMIALDIVVALWIMDPEGLGSIFGGFGLSSDSFSGTPIGRLMTGAAGPYVWNVAFHLIFVVILFVMAGIAWGCFRSTPRSFLEHLMIQCYLLGGMLLVNKVGLIGYLVDSFMTPAIASNALMLLWGIYASRGTVARSWWSAAIFTVGGYVAGFVLGQLMWLFLLIIAVVIMFAVGGLGPTP